ncbi:MAG: zinc ribbon domain-containing protein [Candidatus Thorarchaeota archaeon]|nr:zinc ribbon domain-containing protein [Candidatus Thorarchaeota archaeon]
MRNHLPIIPLLLVTLFLWSALLSPVEAQPPGWSGDANLAFQMEINGVSIADSNSTSPIFVDPAGSLVIELRIDTGADIVLKSGAFVMTYLGVPLINQPFSFGVPLPSGTAQDLLNTSIPLGSLLSIGGITLFTGTITGYFAFIYALQATPTANVTITDDFVLHIGSGGLASIASVSGAITVGFTAMAVFSLLLALDDFQQGILAARKMRKGKTAAGVGIFPAAVVLRRKPKKDAEKVGKEELVSRVSKAASSSWDGKRCPKCGKKWKEGAQSCAKCGTDHAAALKYFSEDIAEYAPRALQVVRPKSKVPVGRFSKRLRLNPQKGGALAAALTEMGVFQTKSVKVPLKKVAFSGMTLSGTYWSWMQMFGGAAPSWIDVLLLATVGLAVSVFIGYFMLWLARVPPLGYEQ